MELAIIRLDQIGGSRRLLGAFELIASAWTEIIRRTSPAPTAPSSSTSFTISPSDGSGMELSTLFELNAMGWTTAYAPLTYTYKQVLSSGQEILLGEHSQFQLSTSAF